MAVLLRRAEQVGHLPLERVEPLVERRDRRLRGRRFVGEASGVRRASLRKNLALHLVYLALEAVEALLGRRRLALGKRRGGRQRNGCGGRERRGWTQGIHERISHSGPKQLGPIWDFSAMDLILRGWWVGRGPCAGAGGGA